jgi:hypothetical protein
LCEQPKRKDEAPIATIHNRKESITDLHINAAIAATLETRIVVAPKRNSDPTAALEIPELSSAAHAKSIKVPQLLLRSTTAPAKTTNGDIYRPS